MKDNKCYNPSGDEGICYMYDRLGNIACMQCGRDKVKAELGFCEMSNGIKKQIENSNITEKDIILQEYIKDWDYIPSDDEKNRLKGTFGFEAFVIFYNTKKLFKTIKQGFCKVKNK